MAIDKFPLRNLSIALAMLLQINQIMEELIDYKTEFLGFVETLCVSTIIVRHRIT